MIITIFLSLFVNDWKTCTNISTEITINIFMFLFIVQQRCVLFIRNLRICWTIIAILKYYKMFILVCWIINSNISSIPIHTSRIRLLYLSMLYKTNHTMVSRDLQFFFDEKWYLGFSRQKERNSISWIDVCVWKISQTDNM